MKDNALYEVIGDKKITQQRHVLEDEQIELLGRKPKMPLPVAMDRSGGS